MKIAAQYNDFTGIAVADHCDFEDVFSYLESIGVNPIDNQPISIFLESYKSTHSMNLTLNIICKHPMSNELTKFIIEDCSANDFLWLFKRLGVILTLDGIKYSKRYIKEVKIVGQDV